MPKTRTVLYWPARMLFIALWSARPPEAQAPSILKAGMFVSSSSEKNEPRLAWLSRMPESMLPTKRASMWEGVRFEVESASERAVRASWRGDVSQSSPNFVVDVPRIDIFIFLDYAHSF